MNNVIIVRYGELFLKSEPVLKKFEKTLIENIKIGLKKEKIKFKILRKRGRIFVETSQIKRSSSVLKRIFGVVSFSPCFNIKSSEIKKIQIFVKKNYKKWIGKNQKFAVRAKRVGRHSYTSQKLAKLIGDVVDRKVDLSNPDAMVVKRRIHKKKGKWWQVPKDIEDISKLKNFTKALVDKGYKNSEVRKILGLNYVRLFGKAWF